MRKIPPKEILKGWKGRLKNGWRFDVIGKSRGIRIMLKVYGDCIPFIVPRSKKTEIGDCYVWDIAAVGPAGGEEFAIELPREYEKKRKAVERDMECWRR